MTDFLTADTNLPSYMMFPRFLLDMEINETAKMLYIILLDRARLSQKNEGWSDIDGHVFIYFTLEALAEVLHKSQMTVKTALAVLEKQKLIFRKRQGPGQPNRIYVKLPKETIHYTDRFLSLRQTENCPIDRQEFKSYSQVISIALVDYFDRYYRTQADPYLEAREREELFVKQIVDAVENSLKQALPLFLSGLTAGMAQREPQIR